MKIKSIALSLFAFLAILSSARAYVYEAGTGDVSGITIWNVDIDDTNAFSVYTPSTGVFEAVVSFECDTYVYVDLNVGIDTDITISWAVGFGNWLNGDIWATDNATPVSDQYHNALTFAFPGDDDPNCEINTVNSEMPAGTVYVRCVGSLYVGAQSAWTMGHADAIVDVTPFLADVAF